MLIAAGALAWRAGYAPRFMAASVDDKLANAPRLSIVVLPFENLSGDKDQDYFADGITEDLTTDLSHVFDFVIARNTAFTYKGKPVDAKQIGRELGVKYLLEGSVRRVGETITINAQLISTETGAHVWADRFEGDRSKLGELSGRGRIPSRQFAWRRARQGRSLAGDARTAEEPGRCRPRDAGNGDHERTESLASVNEAIGLFERALSLDANNVQALLGLSWDLQDRADNFADDNAAATLHARKRRLTPPWPFSLTIRRPITLRVWSTSLSTSGVRRSRRRKRRSPTIVTTHPPMHKLGFYKMFLGHAEDGFADVETALRLSPRDPSVMWWQYFICHFHSHLAQWEQAIEWCNKSVASGNETQWPYTDLAAAHGWLGHMKEAKEAAAQVLKYDPDFTIQGWMESPLHDHWSDDPTFKAQVERFVEGARKAGIPEGEKKTN